MECSENWEHSKSTMSRDPSDKSPDSNAWSVSPFLPSAACLITATSYRLVPPKYSPVVKEAAQSEVIGAIALGLVVAVAAVIVAADVPALMVAVRRLRDIIAT
ncbi:hypothetical protein LSAT2_006340 [Lamellibrachia satsuma]|nr:hypothetical protein LSAT2_006340 [Lamellibrachia satsuma]